MTDAKRIAIYLTGVFVVALCLGVPLLASGPEDVAQQVADASETWAEFFDSLGQRIVRFFTEASYGRMAVFGGFLLGGGYLAVLWRRAGRRG